MRPSPVIGVCTRGERDYEAYDPSERPRLIVDPPSTPNQAPEPIRSSSSTSKSTPRKLTKAEQEEQTFSDTYSSWRRSVGKWLVASTSRFARSTVDPQRLFVGVPQRQIAVRVPCALEELDRDDLRDLILLQKSLFGRGVKWSVALVCADGASVVLPRLDEKAIRKRLHETKPDSDELWRTALDIATEFPTQLDSEILVRPRPELANSTPTGQAAAPKSHGKPPSKVAGKALRRSLRDELRDIARTLKAMDDVFVRLLLSVEHPVRDGRLDVRMAVKPGTADFVQVRRTLQRIRQEVKARNLDVDIGLIALDGCRHV